MRQVRFRAVIALDPAVPGTAPARPRLPYTHELMVRAESLDKPGLFRNFAAELCWDDDAPLHPGDHHVVTVTLTDDDAPRFLGGGRRFTLWSGAEVGHGTISRRVFTEHGPC
jgi:hypothetical protein